MFPLIFSLLIKWSYENKIVKKKKPFEIVIVQPIDPYNEKFTGGPRKQTDKFIRLADSKITPKTQLVVYPETALSYSFYEDDFKAAAVINYFSAVKRWDANILIGASTMKKFNSKNSKALRKIQMEPTLNI